VRGLDYYTRTVFEFESDRLGAQKGVGGGGRYDGLVEQLGGPPTPGIGWAAGVERILLASDAPEQIVAADVFVAVAKPEAGRQAFGVTRRLREHGLRAEMEQAGRSVKGQFKHADRIGARNVVIVGDALELKDMGTGEQRPVSDLDELVRELAG
jgi:histidyl-tRNA synthetase